MFVDTYNCPQIQFFVLHVLFFCFCKSIFISCCVSQFCNVFLSTLLFVHISSTFCRFLCLSFFFCPSNHLSQLSILLSTAFFFLLVLSFTVCLFFCVRNFPHFYNSLSCQYTINIFISLFPIY